MIYLGHARPPRPKEFTAGPHTDEVKEKAKKIKSAQEIVRKKAGPKLKSKDFSD